MAEITETFKRLQQDPQGGSQHVLGMIEEYVKPLVMELDKVLDVRLIRTLLVCLVTIIRLRANKQALWLSELGSYLEGYEGSSSSAPAGTKRVGKLLRSLKWTVRFIEEFLLEKADAHVRHLQAQGQRVLCVWDGSVLEKAESKELEGLCPVISSEAKRKQRSIRGLLFNWPAPRPVRVMGMEWNAGIIVGMQGVPTLAVSRWWATRGEFADKLRQVQEQGIQVAMRKWGRLLVHVFDRGYSSGPWLEVLSRYGVRFIIRWIGKHQFLTPDGRLKKIWEVAAHKKYLAHKLIRVNAMGQMEPCDLWWGAVRHPQSHQSLVLVKARLRGELMYLITNEPVGSEQQAWEIFFSYRRRWQIELSFRYAKCELELECPRLHSLEARLKLLGMVMLVYGFLLSLLDPTHRELVQALLRLKCHRTGKRSQMVQAPLYRLRWALSRLWDDHRPRFDLFLPPGNDPAALVSLICRLERFRQNWG